jgi:hypothetical protein
MSAIFWILGLVNLANGLWMLLSPESWYERLPAGVPDTGPLNVHFVRDIGAAFTTLGAAFCVGAREPGARRGVLFAATLFFGLHALVHVADLASGRLAADHWLIDFPGAFLPVILLGVLCMPRWWRAA